MEDRETAWMRKYGESKTTRIMMATVPHVTSGLGLRKFQADGFLLTRVYLRLNLSTTPFEVLEAITLYCTWSENRQFQSILDKFTRVAKPIPIIGDPDYQLPDKWSSTVYWQI